MHLNQLHDGEKLKTVTDLIRDISGANLSQALSPATDVNKKNILASRANSVAKSLNGGTN